MSYRLSSRKRQARKNFILKTVLGGLLLVLVLALLSVISRPVSNISSSGINQGQEAGSFFGALVTSKERLIEENDMLQQQLDQLNADFRVFDAVVARNQELVRMVGRDITSDFILAGVVKKPPFSPYDIYTIDAGIENGVSVGNLVLFSDFVALGTVSDVNETGAKVSLFSSPARDTQVSINGETYTARGTGGGTFSLRVPRGASISEGDTLLLPGYQVTSIGHVVETIGDPQDGFVEVRAVTPVNVQAVDVVRVSERFDPQTIFEESVE